MIKRSDFADYVTQDLLAGLPGVRARAMFGGYGVYQDDVMFAIIVDDTLYFKVDDSNRKKYEKLGSKPFVYKSRGKRVTMSYWELPAEAMDDRSEILRWAERSIRINTKQR